MKLGSLFDGISGFPLAGSLHGITPVWASEIEPFPIAVSKHHFPNMKHLGSVCDVNGAEIEPVDIITFGSPCQDLSVAGKQAGLEGERSGLFHEAIRIIKEMRDATNGRYPTIALWENVPGAFSSNGGDDFKAVVASFAEIGAMDICWRVLDAQFFGVPQRRRRIFLVADFGGERAREILFEPEGLRGNFEEGRGQGQEAAADAGTGTAGRSFRLTGFHKYADDGTASTIQSRDYKAPTDLIVTLDGTDVARTLTARYDSSPCVDRGQNVVLAFNARQDPVPGPITGALDTQCNTQAVAVYDMTHADEVMRPSHSGLVPTLNARMGTGGNQAPLLHLTPFGPSGQHDIGHCLRAEPSKADKPSSTTYVVASAVDCRNLREVPDISGTLQAKNNGGQSLNYVNPVRVGSVVRRLTPLEAERLMGLPDHWTDIPGASDSKRYKALGNSVAVPVVAWVIGRMAAVLREEATP